MVNIFYSVDNRLHHTNGILHSGEGLLPAPRVLSEFPFWSVEENPGILWTHTSDLVSVFCCK